LLCLIVQYQTIKQDKQYQNIKRDE